MHGTTPGQERGGRACHRRGARLPHVKVGAFDIDGILRGKYVSREKFLSALEGGFGFCDVVLGWDCQDQLYDNVKFTGWHTGYPDAPVRILPDSCRPLPFEDGGLLPGRVRATGRDRLPPRTAAPGDRARPRARVRGVRRFRVRVLPLQETPESVREKNYQGLTPMAPGWFGYSVIRNSAGSDFYRTMLDTFREMDIGIEGLHEETGPGVMEAAITVDKALSAADKAALFKTFAKVVAQKHGLMATFMAKWSKDWPGQSGHIHLSLKSKDGAPVFHDSDSRTSMSETMRWFVGGQQRLMPEPARDDRADDQLLSPAHTDSGRRPMRPGARRTAPPHCASSRQPEITARGVPYRGGRLEPLHDSGRSAGLGTLGNRASGRAGGPV